MSPRILQDPEAAGSAMLAAERNPIPAGCCKGECRDIALVYEVFAKEFKLGGSGDHDDPVFQSWAPPAAGPWARQAKKAGLLGFDPGTADGDYQTKLYGIKHRDGSIRVTRIEQRRLDKH